MMSSIENGEHKNEIHEDIGECAPVITRMRLMDYVPIYIPKVEEELLNQSDHLHFHFSFSHSIGNGSPVHEHSLSDHSRRSDGGRRRHFRVPFARNINWGALIRYLKRWIKNPVNIALLIWLIFVAAGLIMLFLVMTGILDGAIPSSSRRNKWAEVINQILNALFTIMCVYQHPKLFHHLVLLFRWTSLDMVELRRVYCKDGARRNHERAHIMLVVALLHVTCLAQYALCSLYWGFTRKTRPDWADDLCIAVGIASPVIAGVYTVYGPLGRKYDEPQPDEESLPDQHTAAQDQHEAESKTHEGRVVITSPEWIGGLFDCWDDGRVFCASLFCTFFVFGWNMERLGFGNMYVHIVTFTLLVVAPFWVFNISALNVDDDTIKYIVAVAGIVLCVLGLLYGGFWRIQMRKKFKLPPNRFCCGHPSVTDCMQWLFCWSCSLAQEVRTGNFYDVEDDGFCRKVTDEEGRQPLPRIKHLVRSKSCPGKVEPAALQTSVSDDGEEVTPPAAQSLFARSNSMCGEVVHAM